MGDNSSVVSAASSVADLVKQAALEAGFDVAGIAPVRNFPELEYFSPWIAEGCAGEMRYLEARDEAGQLKRAALARVAPWARSVIVCALNYHTAGPYSTDQSPQFPGTKAAPLSPLLPSHATQGWISRYAWSQRDYHNIALPALRQVEARLHEMAGEELQTRCYVDTGPLLERVFARYAGVGWVGKNTCIINQQLGSWLFLGVILTSLELAPDLPAADRCGSCTRCLEACPTGAFLEAHKLDASRCISYLTIEKRGGIPESLRADMGRHVFGCDLCQEVCPWNRKAPVTAAPGFQPRPGLVNPSLSWLATISEEDYRQTFRASPVKRAQRRGLRRNAVVAMGNSGDPRFLPVLRELAGDSDEVVAEHARWAIQRLAAEIAP